MLERGPDLPRKQPDRKEAVLDTIQKTLGTAVQDDPVNDVYRVGRDLFIDLEIFELEMKQIFEAMVDALDGGPTRSSANPRCYDGGPGEFLCIRGLESTHTPCRGCPFRESRRALERPLPWRQALDPGS